jgi:hypothetical protein
MDLEIYFRPSDMRNWRIIIGGNETLVNHDYEFTPFASGY